MNQQKPEKIIHSHNLEVIEIFKTIQGEGPWGGKICTFIRLAGCTLKCLWCDTDYTSHRELLSVEEVVGKCMTIGVDSIVLTGGEPFRQTAAVPLLHALTQNGFHCQVETSGSVGIGNPLPRGTIVVCSPKTGKVFTDQVTDYKYVVEENGVDPLDGLPNRSPISGQALRLARPTVGKDHIFISPWDVQDEEQNHKNTQTAVRVCLQHGYRLSLQIHKLVGLP